MRIFISYRQKDSGGHVLALTDALREAQIHGDACELFVDVETISPGRDFVKTMIDALEKCDVALAVIGRRWLVTEGVRRLDREDDYVRMELRTAAKTRTPVIAVLVDRATMPKAPELPPDLKYLADVEVVPIRDETFDADVARLTAAVGRVERRSPSGPAPATLRLVDAGTGWLASGDQYQVYVDGRKIGLLCSGSAPTEFALPPGRHSVQLRRGLRSSPSVPVAVKPGQQVSLAYEIGLLGIALRPG
jgi:hypothetical protein